RHGSGDTGKIRLRVLRVSVPPVRCKSSSTSFHIYNSLARRILMPHSDAEPSLTVRRSELACPAHSLKMMARAAAGDADEVIFDLEDGCAPSQKVSARKTLVEAFTTLDFQGKLRAFRANGIHTKFFY